MYSRIADSRPLKPEESIGTRSEHGSHVIKTRLLEAWRGVPEDAECGVAIVPRTPTQFRMWKTARRRQLYSQTWHGRCSGGISRPQQTTSHFPSALLPQVVPPLGSYSVPRGISDDTTITDAPTSRRCLQIWNPTLSGAQGHAFNSIQGLVRNSAPVTGMCKDSCSVIRKYERRCSAGRLLEATKPTDFDRGYSISCEGRQYSRIEKEKKPYRCQQLEQEALTSHSCPDVSITQRR